MSKSNLSPETVQQIADNTYKVVIAYKDAIKLIEGEIQQDSYFNKVLSKEFDLTDKQDKELIKILNENKTSVTQNKTTAFILSNLGEIYYNTRMYNKALITLSISNLFFSQFENNSLLYYKNNSLIAMCFWKMFNTKCLKQINEIFDKIQNHLHNMPNSYEKVFILRTFSEFLFEVNKDSIQANSK